MKFKNLMLNWVRIRIPKPKNDCNTANIFNSFLEYKKKLQKLD